MLKLFLISAVLIGIGIVGMAIKIWGKKDGEFDGTCSGRNVKLKAKGISCSCGGSGTCENDGTSKYHEHPHIEVEHLS